MPTMRITLDNNHNQNDDDKHNVKDHNGDGQEPQQQAVFFYRRLLRAESYRKALVWQKRFEYQHHVKFKEAKRAFS